MSDDDKRSEEQARAQLRSIVEMMACLDLARNGEKATWKGQEVDEEGMDDIINQDPLSVEVRSDWHVPGGDSDEPAEYRILLCWGGPAVQITGKLSEHAEPETARIEHQDWFTPYRPLTDTTDEEDEALLAFAQCFYYGG